MGCHTWAYRKIKETELDSVKEDLVKKLENDLMYYTTVEQEQELVEIDIGLCKDYVLDKSTPEEFRQECQSHIDNRELAVQEVRKTNNRIKEAIRNIKKCDTVSQLADMWDSINDSFLTSTDYASHDGSLYQYVAFDEPYRVYGYPEETFTDCYKFIEWLADTDREYTREDELRIRNFWKKYDNEVYLTFG